MFEDRTSKLITLPSSYRLEELMKFFNARKSAYHTNPRLIDEVIYTPYTYAQREDTKKPKVGDLLGDPELRAEHSDSHEDPDGKHAEGKRKKKFDQGGGTGAEMFLFNYGVVVIWGMTEAEEKRFLTSMCVLSSSASHREADYCQQKTL